MRKDVRAGHGRISPDELVRIYHPIKDTIEARLAEFKLVWGSADDEELFRELAFCLLTPQSKARVCWSAVCRLVDKGLLTGADAQQIAEELSGVRFHHRKALYITLARGLMEGRSLRETLSGFPGPFQAREWLVGDVIGLGYKEASHFLRNIGIGEDLAILDRHILRNLELLGVIEEVPAALTRRAYLEIEGRMAAFSEQIKVPMGHLDLLLWYKETGEVFK
ncbi:MAG: N-glycosylase/DNA lyase [Methanothrix sp.]|nr:N-glycosylase/DNA lyase [Methanothrix sp.]